MKRFFLAACTLGVMACGSDSSGPRPVTGRYTSADGGSLFIDSRSYTVSFNQQLVEVGSWTQDGTQLILNAEPCSQSGGIQPCSNDVSSLRIGAGTLDGTIAGRNEHFTRISA
ncbi:MAG: hypothetical protein ACJ8AK_02955 [Gemmatimonadaceae bacterium]